jgi:hypothetical protein
MPEIEKELKATQLIIQRRSKIFGEQAIEHMLDVLGEQETLRFLEYWVDLIKTLDNPENS